MKRIEQYILLFILIVCFVWGCTKPYNPKVITTANNYLVVEGTINTGGDSTMIKLSRTVNLTNDSTANPVSDATVAIQDDQNDSYSLQSLNNGYYTSPVLNLGNTHKYRLSITTSDGKVYLSDYVSPVATPAIDSVGYVVKSNGVQIYLNTHDPNNNTHYYHWDYVETWQFSAKYDSQYISDGTQINYRTPAQDVYACYGNSISNNILLGSSAKLSQDVIYQAPITFISSTSEKIEQRYSILIKQSALTQDAYNYFQLLKQNTEDLGSIFDAQPSASIGNLQNVNNPAEPVIGYISAGTVSQTRIFINRYTQLPQPYYVAYFDNDPYNQYSCNLDTGLPPASAIWGLKPEIIAATGTDGSGYEPPACADCTLRGSSTKPSYWP